MESLYNINSFYNLYGTNLNLCRDVSDILKLCIRFDEEEKIIFYKIMAFSNLKFFRFWLVQDDKFVISASSTVFKQLTWNFA